jgi:hypothetical protein
MRSRKIVSALVAIAAALLAIAPTWASARPARARHLGVNRPCHIHLETTKAPLSPGESTTIGGQLKCPRSEEAVGRQVTIFEQSAPKPGFVSLGSVTTTSISTSKSVGAFQLSPPVFQTNSVFYAVAEGVQSAHRTIRVFASITPSKETPPEGAQLLAGGHGKQNRVTFSGEVNPHDAGALVVLQRELNTATEEWRAIDRATVDEFGKYSIVHHFLIPGDANIRVVVHPRRINAPAATSPVSYEISQVQNPALTIEPTSKAPNPNDPIPFGSSVTIKGVVSAAATGTPLTLLAHGRGGASFAPVATGHTGDGGSYEFSVTPLANTFYRVATATASSSVLFEGVKYALTLTPPPATVQAGQPLSISGSILPPLAGHVVYLERQGPFAFGYSVIDLGNVGSPAKPGEAAPFSIVHTFYSPGARILRVKIPGDPANQGAASMTFSVNVTPAPASTLRPEAFNPKLPSEGQL